MPNPNPEPVKTSRRLLSPDDPDLKKPRKPAKTPEPFGPDDDPVPMGPDGVGPAGIHV